MKYSWLFLIPLCAVLFSCNKESITVLPADEAVQEGPAFTLTATLGNPDTRLSFDDDGLGTTWQPGDKLYLVDLAGKNSTVTLSTRITSPAKSATFTSESSVLSGDYVVLFGTEEIRQYNVPYWMTDLATLGTRLKFYGSLSVSDGQTSASISLSHVYAKLSFKFRNVPAGLTNMKCGMAACSIGLPILEYGSISTDGWTPDLYVPTASFSWNNGADSYVLIPPEDYSNTRVFFYLCGDDASGNHKTYEILKNGINLQAGINYNITLDFSTATSQSTISKVDGIYSLSNPEDFRAAAYWDLEQDYSVANDVDFSDQVFFPIRTSGNYTLDGNNHVLSGIIIDLAKCNNVGVVSVGCVKNLVVKTSSVLGDVYVGGIVGYGYATQCGYEGNVTGVSQVGGVSGSCWDYSDKCYAIGTISGSSYVGGVAGEGNLANSYFIGTVSGDRSVGGIAGSGNQISNCYSYGTVSSGNGIAGQVRNGNTVQNCLTSLSILSPKGGYNCEVNCGPDKTFLSQLSVINYEEAFSTQVWSNIDAGCPLLRWQADVFGGEIPAPGFGNVDW